MRYEFIYSHPEYPVAKWVKFLEVSRSGYYEWVKKREYNASKRKVYSEKIEKIFNESGGTYGPDRICGVMRNEGYSQST